VSLVTDSLAPQVVEPLLTGRFGSPYLYFERCESTQRELPPDAPEGAVAVAEEQTAGRGRLGRRWFAPPRSSLLMSLNLRPDVPTPRLPGLTIVGASAVADTLAGLLGLDPKIRDPNDVLIGGRKVAGILAEAREERVVLGIGINVNLTPDELPKDVDTPATSLAIECGRRVNRADLLSLLLHELEEGYEIWLSEGGVVY
jgi:BirA family transcriptional regulator, biotin operon repressor / biotin---[acetyl-CoA-carboxylase] ligase